jgi:hypothetical protein
VAAGTSLILLALGSGLGFAEVSPWAAQGVSATTFTVTMAIWLIVTQWVSALFGGYIAGRLRTTWTGTHTHEVFFRDTANGLVTWAVSTVFITAVAASSVISAIGGSVHSAVDVASGTARAVNSAGLSSASAYGIDRLFRQAPSGSGSSPGSGSSAGAITQPSNGDARAEAARIIANAAVTGNMPDADRTYVSQLVAERAGVTPDEAQKRVTDWITDAMAAEAKAKAAADEARAAASQAAIYTALSLLIGAFIASVAAAIGGRLRDEHP